MNKRIQELIEQATESKGFLTAGDSVPPLPVKEFNKEKFAELIIEECAYVADENYIHRGSRTCGLAIRLHFGVEE